MDDTDPDTILTDLQFQNLREDEDGQIYYTILQDQDLNENFGLKLEEDDLSDANNVLYLSFNNEETEEPETNQNDISALEEPESNVNMEFFEPITLPDGTQAYLTKDSTNDNLFEKNEDSFELDDSSALLQNIGENFDDIMVKISNSDDEDCNVQNNEINLENSIVTQDGDEEFDASKYQQIQMEDGTVAIIEIGLFNKIIEQSKKNEQQASIDNTQNDVTEASCSRSSFVCSTEGCGKSYTTMHHLRVHMRVHNGSRPYSCEVEGCNKTFATGYSLKAHSRTHTGEKPYACQYCEKKFKTSGDLQKHNRIHTGEKPFVCPIEGCGRSFTTSNIRKVHIRSHTGERPYECPEPGCNKAFASATNYKNHMRIHSGEKPYACSFEGCGKRFTEYSSLYKHQVVHNSTRYCKCEYCGRTCRHPSTLIAHKRSVHNIIVTDNGTEIMVKMIDNDDSDEDDDNEEMEDTNTQIFFVTQ